MAAMLSEWLGVVYLTPSAAGGVAGGAAVAAIWERIHAHEAANEPLPADLALWKKRSGVAAIAAMWERIHAHEAANVSSSRQATENMAEILSTQPRLLQMVATTQKPVDRPPNPQSQKNLYRCMWCDSTFTTTNSARRHGAQSHGERFDGSKRYPPSYYSIAF
jgi:hypothetical protein